MQNGTFAQALLAPAAIALVGASGDPAKNTARPLRFMRKHGYHGRIFPINATRSEILGEPAYRSEEHTSELQSLMRISYAVFCLKKKIHNYKQHIVQHKQPKHIY